MSFLAGRLGFEESARLTEVVIFPRGDECAALHATAYHHWISMNDDVDPSVMASALATFVPSTVATFCGVTDGWGTWCVLVQVIPEVSSDAMVPAQGGPVPRSDFATSAVDRALQLLRVDVHPDSSRVTWIFGGDYLRSEFEDDGVSVEHWPVADIALALLVELATCQNRNFLVNTADGISTPSDGPAHDRRAYLESELAMWASTYSGPGPS